MTISDFVAYMAVITSVFSIIYSIFYNKITFLRKEKLNTILNKPNLNVCTTTNSITGEFKVELLNNGLGPAILKGIKYELNATSDKSVLKLISKEVFETDSIKNIKYNFSIHKTQLISDGATISNNSSMLLYSDKIIMGEDSDANQLKEVLKRIQEIVVTIDYRDIFENEFIKVESF